MSHLQTAPVDTSSPFRRAMLAQLGGLLAVVVLAAVRPETEVWGLVWVQGLVAAVAAMFLRLPRWWWLISLLFTPLAMLGQRLAWPSWVWLLAFVSMLLIFWRTDASRVPLYMTNSRSTEALSRLLTEAPGRFVDLGCGDGHLLRRLARVRPDWQFVGVEHAPLTMLWARLLGLGLPNLSIRYGSIWSQELAGYDFVYAFLSPVPMARLWTKAQAELRPGARLVSNSFAVPDVPSSAQVQVEDGRRTCLWVYDIAVST